MYSISREKGRESEKERERERDRQNERAMIDCVCMWMMHFTNSGSNVHWLQHRSYCPIVFARDQRCPSVQIVATMSMSISKPGRAASSRLQVRQRSSMSAISVATGLQTQTNGKRCGVTRGCVRTFASGAPENGRMRILRPTLGASGRRLGGEW